MPIHQTMPESQIAAMLSAGADRLRRAVVRQLMVAGERVRNEAVARGSYRDRTGNLRHSVGYVVLVDGRVASEAFDGGEGGAEGRRLAAEVARRFPRGAVLVVVAGMRYASYVAARGYDVLDSAELMAERIVPELLDELKRKK